jgi:hypothetical protein
VFFFFHITCSKEQAVVRAPDGKRAAKKSRAQKTPGKTASH